MDRSLVLAAAVWAGLGVALGAFGAHGLQQRIPADRLAIFEIGVRYQMYHALALFGVAWLSERLPGSSLVIAAGWLFVAGIVIFSGSLYALALSGIRMLGRHHSHRRCGVHRRLDLRGPRRLARPLSG